jgi:YD repeat-containing protein
VHHRYARTFNDSNQLLTRDTDGGSADHTLDYDAVGNMTADGKDYTYTYDAFGRLRKVTSTTPALVAEYRYNGLGFRMLALRHHDQLHPGHRRPRPPPRNGPAGRAILPLAGQYGLFCYDLGAVGLVALRGPLSPQVWGLGVDAARGGGVRLLAGSGSLRGGGASGAGGMRGGAAAAQGSGILVRLRAGGGQERL